MINDDSRRGIISLGGEELSPRPTCPSPFDGIAETNKKTKISETVLRWAGFTWGYPSFPRRQLWRFSGGAAAAVRCHFQVLIRVCQMGEYRTRRSWSGYHCPWAL